MSQMFSVLSALLLAYFFVLGQTTPIAEESTLIRHNEKEENEISTTEMGIHNLSDHSHAKNTEDNHPSTLSNDGIKISVKEERIASTSVPLTGDGMPDMEENKKENRKGDAEDDDDDDDDDDSDSDSDEDEERGGAMLKSFSGLYNREKRSVSLGESEDEKETQTEFIDHVLDYNLDRKKREENDEMETATEIDRNGERKKRQNGETVPYITENRSRREKESDEEEEEESSGIRKEGEEEDEKEEEEEKKEEMDEKLAMES